MGMTTIKYDDLVEHNNLPNGRKRGAKTGTVYLRYGQGTGIVECDTPLDPTTWEKYVTGGLYEVDSYGMPVPTPGRPLAFQPDYETGTDEHWRAYAVATMAMSPDAAAGHNVEELRRQLHLNPNSSAR